MYACASSSAQSAENEAQALCVSFLWVSGTELSAGRTQLSEIRYPFKPFGYLRTIAML